MYYETTDHRVKYLCAATIVGHAHADAQPVFPPNAPPIRLTLTRILLAGTPIAAQACIYNTVQLYELKDYFLSSIYV